jgi:hypothetical protein
MKYEIYKTDKGKTYVAVDRALGQEKALTLVNEHFKTSKKNLIVERGRTLGNELIVPNKTGDVWAVSRRTEHDNA